MHVNLTWGLGAEEDVMTKYMIISENGKLFIKNFIIYEINMDYYNKLWYSKNEDEIKKNLYMIMLDLDKKKIQNSLLSEARENGINDGISKGVSQEKVSIAKNLLSMNKPIEDISKATGLSVEEINKLRNN